MGRKPAKSSRYHHGDLRAAILEAAIEVLAERGFAGLSLRECARRAGVSHAAPYRHFEDKDALLLAIAEEGFDALYAAATEAMEGLDDPRARLDAYGVAYVRHAIEHPEHHRVMFTAEKKGPEDVKSSTGQRAFELLVEAASAMAGPDEDPHEAAVAAWSLPHGLSMLILDGRIPAEHVDTVERVESLARTCYRLWRGPLGAGGDSA